MKSTLGDFADGVDLNRTRLTSRPKFIFLCGGPIEGGEASLRSLILEELKRSRPELANNVVLAEQVLKDFEREEYSNLLEFEDDLAQLCALVVVFAEGPGALAELGAFSLLAKTAPKLMVVVDHGHYQQRSFIRLGPVESVRLIDERQVQVYPWLEPGTGRVRPESVADFQDELIETIDELAVEKSGKSERLQLRTPVHDLFAIHALALLVGALLFDEIKTFLNHFELEPEPISDGRLRQYLEVLRGLSLIKKHRRGHRDYYLSNTDRAFVGWSFRPDARTNDVMRWREIFRSALVADAGRRSVVKRQIAGGG